MFNDEPLRIIDTWNHFNPSGNAIGPSQEWIEGWRVCNNSIDCDNPYDENTQQYLDWLSGFCEAISVVVVRREMSK